MADTTFSTESGRTIAREKLIAYLNTGTNSAPVWSAIGKSVEESSAEYDWNRESSQDILGNAYSTMKKPVITQTFDPLPLEAGDAALEKLWNLAIKDQDAQSLAAQDMLIVHLYAGATAFAERYSACAIQISSLGGAGGGSIEMPIEVTYGGTRTVGTATASDGTVTFTPGV